MNSFIQLVVNLISLSHNNQSLKTMMILLFDGAEKMDFLAIQVNHFLNPFNFLFQSKINYFHSVLQPYFEFYYFEILNLLFRQLQSDFFMIIYCWVEFSKLFHCNHILSNCLFWFSILKILFIAVSLASLGL